MNFFLNGVTLVLGCPHYIKEMNVSKELMLLTLQIPFIPDSMYSKKITKCEFQSMRKYFFNSVFEDSHTFESCDWLDRIMKWTALLIFLPVAIFGILAVVVQVGIRDVISILLQSVLSVGEEFYKLYLKSTDMGFENGLMWDESIVPFFVLIFSLGKNK